MEEVVHEYILNEILRYFIVKESTARYLIKYTSRPDRKPFENIKSFELPPAKEWYEHVGNAFLYAGNAFMELHKWITLHTSEAPEQFLTHFEIAKEILIDSPSKDKKRQEKGLKNLAYAIHYIVDIGTPYHSITLMDLHQGYIKDLDMIDEGTDLNDINKKFLCDLLAYVAGHTYFEKKVVDLFENQPYRKSLLNTINTKVKSIKQVPDFKHPEELLDKYKKLIKQLKNTSKNGYENIDLIFKQSTYKGSIDNDEELNKEILEFSLWCISNITVVITLTILCFFNKRKRKNPKNYIKRSKLNKQ